MNFIRSIQKQRQFLRQVMVATTSSQPWRTLVQTHLTCHNPPRLQITPWLAGFLGLALVNCGNSGQQEKFFRAVQRGHVGEVERLLKNRAVDLKGKHELGWTALHLAAVNGRQEVQFYIFLFFS